MRAQTEAFAVERPIADEGLTPFTEAFSEPHCLYQEGVPPQACEIGAGTFAVANVAPPLAAPFSSIKISRKSWPVALIAVSVAPGGTKKTLPGCTGISTRPVPSISASTRDPSTMHIRYGSS